MPRTVQELLRGTGPGRARPRPRRPGAAPGEEGRALKKSWPAGRVLPRQGPQDPGRRRGPRCGWRRGDPPAAAPVTLPRRRLRPIGAPGGGAPYCRSCGRPGTEDCAGFLTGACNGYGRFVTFPDSAPCHRPGALKRLLKKTGGKVRTCCFPPHAPEPGPAGVQWKPLGKAAGNRPYGGAEKMRESVSAVPRGEETPIVKTLDYLAR